MRFGALLDFNIPFHCKNVTPYTLFFSSNLVQSTFLVPVQGWASALHVSQ